MDRRGFLGAVSTAVLMPGGALLARSLPPSHLPVDHFFFDERFPEARRRASSVPAVLSAVPVGGDVTPIWSSTLAEATRARPLTIRGVTTESFLFCLGVLTREQAGVRSQVVRVGADLRDWTLHTLPQRQPRASQWQHHFPRA